MDSPIARGAEPCGKYLMEMLKKFLRFLDTGLKKDLDSVVPVSSGAKHNKHQHHCDEELNSKGLQKENERDFLPTRKLNLANADSGSQLCCAKSTSATHLHSNETFI